MKKFCGPKFVRAAGLAGLIVGCGAVGALGDTYAYESNEQTCSNDLTFARATTYAWPLSVENDTDGYAVRDTSAGADSDGWWNWYAEAFVYVDQCGPNTHYTRAKGIASAGPSQPFGLIDPDPTTEEGFAELTVDHHFANGVATVNGTANFNGGGFFEVSLIDWNGRSPVAFAELIEQHRSVSLALEHGAIEPGRVLLLIRESDVQSGEPFVINTPLQGVLPRSVIFEQVVHAVGYGEPCEGDITGEGTVDLIDLATMLSNFGTPTGANITNGDLDGDADVDISDLALMLSRFGQSCA